ncbi:Protein yeeZ [Tetrabaena socialis]|uniref:Protein yeeZ n=1 Tax=Tetrabaena socialis TaxID=47790 RepID=A0A2J7ZTJ1_9CHLO|nr:Protein yeeZ [Tetrabaena socialis]|eukprot:PNH03591.1 Protein yeeZ [Tetrabaena socialis]
MKGGQAMRRGGPRGARVPGRAPCRRVRASLPGTQAAPDQRPLPSSKSIFVFGLGYTSVALGNWLAAEGWSVSGTCRTPARVEGLRARGWAVECFDPARGVALTPELQQRLADSPYVLSSVPPLAMALYDPALSAQRALLRPLAAAGHVAWFGYLSSTGVYGDWQGEWVDEGSLCRQTSSKAIVRQEAEAAWLQLQQQAGLPVHVFRLGGIYGPGRSVLDSLEAEPSDLSSSQQRRGRQRYTARCHVHDICAVLAASMAAPNPGRVYNIVDDDPAPRGDVMSYARSLVFGSAGTTTYGTAAGTAAMAGACEPGPGTSSPEQDSVNQAGPAPPLADAVPGPSGGPVSHPGPQAGSLPAAPGDGAEPGSPSGSGGGGRGGGRGGCAVLEEKRVSNARIKAELGVVLRYPTYREGVAAIHGGQLWPLGEGDLALL